MFCAELTPKHQITGDNLENLAHLFSRSRHPIRKIVPETRKSVFTTFPKNNDKGVENRARSGVFWTKFEVFGNVVKLFTPFVFDGVFKHILCSAMQFVEFNVASRKRPLVDDVR